MSKPPPSSSSPDAPSTPNRHRPNGLSPPGTFTFPPRDAPRASPSPMSAHRQSFSDQLRGLPASPRSQRQPSLSQQAFQELRDNPPLPHKANNEFEGRDWKTIRVAEVVDPSEVHWAQQDSTVEEATTTLITRGAPNVVLIRDDEGSKEAVSTFDYSDLQRFLLLVVGLAHPDENHAVTFDEVLKKARSNQPVGIRELDEIGSREMIVKLPHTAHLPQAVEIFASGVHRIIIVKEGTQDVMGVLSQLRLVRFFWEYGRHFPALQPLFDYSLSELGIGSRVVRSINGDKPLSDALQLMSKESITSLPVLDNSNNVVGNISHVDVRLLTKSSDLPLLRSTCIHFISVILSEGGMEAGKDSFPVFYINPHSTLAHTVAKLVATRSHRMWIVDAPSPGHSQTATPAAVPSTPIGSDRNPQTSGPPYTGTNGPAVSASALPGQNMSGRLSGVVSLTDVLNLFAKASGLDPREPDDARRRRRSSSSSVRSSADMSRSSTDLRGSATLPQR